MFKEKNTDIKRKYEHSLIVDRDEYIVFKIELRNLDSFLRFVSNECQIESGVQINHLNGTTDFIVRYYPFTMDTKKHINKYYTLLDDVARHGEFKTDKKIPELDTNFNKNKLINQIVEYMVDNTEPQLTDENDDPVLSRENRKNEMKLFVEDNYDTTIKTQYFESKIIRDVLFRFNIFYLDKSDDPFEIEFGTLTKSKLSDYAKPIVLKMADRMYNDTALDIFDIYYNEIDCGYSFEYGDDLDIIRELIKKYNVSDVLFSEKESKVAFNGFDGDINQLIVKLEDADSSLEFLKEFREKIDETMLTTHIDKSNDKNVVFWGYDNNYTIKNNQTLMLPDPRNNKIYFDSIEIDKYKNATLYKDDTEIELDLRGLEDEHMK